MTSQPYRWHLPLPSTNSEVIWYQQHNIKNKMFSPRLLWQALCQVPGHQCQVQRWVSFWHTQVPSLTHWLATSVGTIQTRNPLLDLFYICLPNQGKLNGPPSSHSCEFLSSFGGDGGIRNQIDLKYRYYCLIQACMHAQSCPTLCDPMGYSPPGSSGHGTVPVIIMEWVAIPFSRGSSRPRDWTWVSCIAGRLFTIWATREAPWWRHCFKWQ